MPRVDVDVWQQIVTTNGEPDETVKKAAAPREHKSLSRSLSYFFTTAIGQGMAFLLLPFVTRALPAEEYGAYALALAVSSLVSVFASAWIRNVAIRVYYDARSAGTTRGFFYGVQALQFATFVVLYSVVLLVMSAMGAEVVSWRVLISAGVAASVGAFAMFAFEILRVEQRAGAYATAEIGGGVLRFVVTLAGIAIGIRSAELLLNATSFGYLIAAFYAMWVLGRRLSGPMRLDLGRVAEVVRFGPASLPFSVASWTERMFDRLVIDHYLGTAVVGVYSVGYTLGERTIGLVVKAVFMMAWPNILSAWEKGGTAAARVAVTTAHRLYAWFSVGPTVFMVVFGEELVRLIAGATYHESAPIVPIIAVSMWAEGLARLLNRHYELRKRFAFLSWLTVLGALVNLILNLVLVPTIGVMGAAWATMVNRAFNVIVFYATRDRALVAIPVGAYAQALSLALLLWAGTAATSIGDLPRMTLFVTVYGLVALFVMRRTDG